MLGRRPLITGGRGPGAPPARPRRVPTALVASAVAVSFLLGTACAAAVTVTSKGLATGMLPVPAYGCTDTRRLDTPVSYWRLDETSGTSATDTTGGRTGTYTGGYTLGQTGALSDTADKAVSFNGTTGYVAVPYAAALNPTQFTLEAWAKPTGGAGTWRLVASSWTHPSDYQGYWVGIDSNDHWTAHIGNGVNPEANADGPTATLNTWTHLAETYDGTTLRLYVNGTLAGTAATTRYTPNTSPTQFEIGAEYFSGAQASFFPGSIDEVSLYNSALTATKIRAHYNAERCYRDEVLLDSPTAYWRLGETPADSTARDAKNTYPGTYANGPTRAAAGALNLDNDTSTTFDGSTNYVTVPYVAALNPNSVTLEAWAKPTGGTGTARTIAATQDTNKGYLLGIGTDNKWRFTVGTGSAVNVAASTATVTLNTWAHVVGVYNGTAATLYVDGLSVGTTTTARSANTTRPLGIGATDSGGTWAGFFPGSIDEVAVYGSALSQTRIQAHYLVGRSYKDTVLDTGPVSFWRLGESSGTSAADSAGSNTGTYTSSPTLGQSGSLAGDSDTAVSFNGSNYVARAYTASLNPTQFTMEAWAKPVGGAGNYGAVAASWYDDGVAPKGSGIWYNSSDQWEIWMGNGTNYYVLTGPSITANGWTHLAYNFDGTTLRMYVNGALATSMAAAHSPNASMAFGIGAAQYPGSPAYWQDFFSGRIDDVAVYNRALTATEIQLHYDSGRR